MPTDTPRAFGETMREVEQRTNSDWKTLVARWAEGSRTVVWQMASLAGTDAAHFAPDGCGLRAGHPGHGVIGWRFIFPVPALFSATLLIPLVAAYVVAR